jgi:predicted RNA-binding Zn-ribbon protein involved in translation (DUF1610 family)
MKCDVNFDCPKCGQNLDAPPDLAGLFVECPACGAVIRVPAASGQPTRPPPEQAHAPAAPAFTAPPTREEDKESTMRIDLPEEFRLPPPKPRTFTIKRLSR